jgi:phosphoglycolate phosphatase-like HAD superfamily hydrolase
LLLGDYGYASQRRQQVVKTTVGRGERRAAVEKVVVGDTIYDIAAARACGVKVVAVATGSDPADRLGEADAVFASMTELPDWHAARFG